MTTASQTADAVFDATRRFADAINRDLYGQQEGYLNGPTTDAKRVLADPAAVLLRCHTNHAHSGPADQALHPTVAWALGVFVQRFGSDDRMYYRLAAQIDIANVRDDNSEDLAVRLLEILTQTYADRAQLWRISSATNKTPRKE